MLGLVILKLALAAGCVEGSLRSCTLSGCAVATQTCAGGYWDPCTCDDACASGAVESCSLSGCAIAERSCQAGAWGACTCRVPATCVNGSAAACTLAGCAAAQTICAGGLPGPCQCAIQTCDDGNACTADAVAGTAGSYFCTHAPRTGVACSDGDPCNGSETCSAAGACLPGTPPDLNDGNPCTYDYCDVGGIHHDTVASCAPADTGPEVGATPGTAPSPLGQPVPQMANVPGLEIAENTGEVRYRYEFTLPAARGRYQPGLRLTYSSASPSNQGYGHGWSLSTSYVELSSQGGPFQLFVGGQPVALVGMADGTYRPEIGAALVSLTPSMGGFTGTDLVGNVYTFDTFFGWDVMGTGGRWYLRSVVDVDGNKTLYSYQRESGPLALLATISYNNYVVSGVESFGHQVVLGYAERLRGDQPAGQPLPNLRWTADLAGGTCNLGHLLDTVSVRAGGLTARSWLLGYTNLWIAKPGRPARVVMSSITPRDSTGTRSLPPTTFQYDTAAVPGYTLLAGQTFLAPMSPYQGSDLVGSSPTSMWIDLDGDGLVDRVGNAAGGGLLWARNTTTPGSVTITFAPVAVLAGTVASGSVPAFSLIGPFGTTPSSGRTDDAAIADMNGDGLPDLVQDALAYGATGCVGLQVRLAYLQGGQVAYAPPTCFAGPAYVAIDGFYVDQHGRLSDVNFDGAMDYADYYGDYLSTGVGFTGLQPKSTFRRGTGASTLPLVPPFLLPPATPVAIFTPGDCRFAAPDFGLDLSTHPEATCTFAGDPREQATRADIDGDGILDDITTNAVLWGAGAGAVAAASVAVPTIDPRFVASSPDWRKTSCECNFQGANGQWLIRTGTGPRVWGWDAGFVDLNADGVADYVTNGGHDTNPSGSWVVYVGQLPPTLLRSVTIGTGATAAIGYTLASTFKATPRQGIPWVATSLSISGPRMPSATSYYWYDQPKGGQLWYLPLRYEPRGFAHTWAYDGATQLVRETTWATGSHVFWGSPTRVSWATLPQPIGSYNSAQPPSGYSEFRRVEMTLAARARGSPIYTDSSAEPPSYPVVPVTTSATTTAWIGSISFSSRRTVSCADVDDYGNTLLATVDPDTAVSGDETYELASFDASATCKSCPISTTTARAPSGTPPNWLARSEYLYDAPIGGWSATLPFGQAGAGRLAYVRRYSSMLTSEVASAIIYNSNGTVASRVMDPYAGSHARSWTESYTYDPQGLRVTKTRVSDAGIALVKDATYDALGQLVLEQGPYVEGSLLSKPARAYAYDGFGRVLAVGRSVSGAQMAGAISAAEYVDASPPTVRSYTFLAPLTITIGSVPVRPDVKQVVTHVDGLGRALEVRERLGVAGTLDPAAKITQTLAGYRVTQSVKYDAAGRATASLEPQLRPNTPTLSTEAYEGFDVLAAAANARGALTLYDAQGRISCSMAGVYAAVTATGTACTSSLADSAQFRIATPHVYGTATQYGRAMATARANAPTSTNQASGTTVYYRADGLVATTYDFYGNASEFTYDLLGRPTALTRTAKGKAASAQTTTKAYDLLGRIVAEWDANWSPGSGPTTSPTPGPTANPKPTASRLYEYDGAGRIYRVRLPFDPAAMTRAELRYEYKSLGRRTKAYALEPTLVAGGVTFAQRTLADIAYDNPYTGSASYGYVAGQAASIASPLTTIAMGYDQNGRTTRRDQWFTGLTGAFSATGGFSDDGRLLTAGFTSGYSVPASWQGSYDSAGRPVKVALSAPTLLAAALWEAPLVGSVSPYDRLDRIGNVKSNGGLVTTIRNYSIYTGQLIEHGVSTAAAQVHGASEFVYLATKLKHFRDTVSGTIHDYAYDANGRLVAMGSGYGTGPLAQSYSQSHSFSDAAWAAGATVGNLERVTDWLAGGAVVSYDYAQDRLVSTSNAAGATVTKLLHDHAGRLTSKQTSTGTETEGFAYDLQDQLRQVKRSGVVTEKLEYDPTGAPLYRTVGTQAIYYVGPFATVTATMNAGCTAYGCSQGVTGVQVSAHVILAGSRIASVRAANVLYYHRDRQGSVVATTYTGGYIGVRYRYTPYGQLDKVQVVSPAGGADSTYGSEIGYTGGLRLGWNPSTGAPQGDLLLLGARVYDAALKRWLQADTVDQLRYTYTDGDPVNPVDPSGRAPLGSDEKDRVCLGGWCVNPITASFFMERTFGYCTDPAECQLILGGVEHDQRVSNRIRIIERVNAYGRYLDAKAAFLNSIPPEVVAENMTYALPASEVGPASGAGAIVHAANTKGLPSTGFPASMWFSDGQIEAVRANVRFVLAMWRMSGWIAAWQFAVDAMKTGGIWDYKSQLPPVNFEGRRELHQLLQDLGNFNYGAVGASLVIPLDALQRFAGWYGTRGGVSDPTWGKWYGRFPYGDNPRSQEYMRLGYRFYEVGMVFP